jgi:hypothetical protein
MAYTFCFGAINTKAFPFLSDGVAAIMASILESTWPTNGVVISDLCRRDAGCILSEVMPLLIAI